MSSRRTASSARAAAADSAAAATPATSSAASAALPRWLVPTLLAVLLAVAALVRVVALPESPPGLNQDEAINSWNAWCLLKTGQDQAGVHWPIFYTRALGENRTTLYIYWTLPFTALGGLNIWTTRLPSAVAGILAVALAYWIATRLFGRIAGVLAAAILAVNPWQVVLSRMGHEAALGPFVVLLALATLLWAGLPLQPNPPPLRPWRALLAGLLAGLACYGYPAIRLFLPAFLALGVLVNGRAWWRLRRVPRGPLSLAALAIGVAATFGPLVFHHIVNAREIARRADSIWLWRDFESVPVRIGRVMERYAEHFGPDFLFVAGDHFEMQNAHGFGVYQWYTLPLMLAGLAVAVRTCRKNVAARLVLVWLLAYPLGDCLNSHGFRIGNSMFTSLHALRSAPGVGGPLLLAALGGASLLTALWRWRRKAALAAALGLALLAAVLDARFVHYLFTVHPQRPEVCRCYQTDLVAATQALRPDWPQADAVFTTLSGLNQPYIVMLVTLGYSPQQWLTEPRDIRSEGIWDNCYQFGRFYFLYPRSGVNDLLQKFQADPAPNRVLWVLRPEEARRMQIQTPPSFTAQTPGRTLQVFDTRL
jgi:hypothetical protein